MRRIEQDDHSSFLAEERALYRELDEDAKQGYIDDWGNLLGVEHYPDQGDGWSLKKESGGDLSPPSP